MVGASLITVPLVSEETDELSVLKEEAVTIVKQFAGSLKPQLLEAIESGGPAHAIDICSSQAPEIANKLSQETGWQIRRVSLKPRNSDSAEADDWERKTLLWFEQQQEKQEPPANMIHAEIVESRFRFMKAQPVEALCLNCHGETLVPEVSVAIKQHYPNDQATGYSLGQIRGAISLSKDL